MIDLHTHTLHSDGELIPAEFVRRARVAGYRLLALTDHADASNLETVISALRSAVAGLGSAAGLRVLAGVEITHVPPAHIPDMIRRARELGAEWVVVHGETPVEPVEPGTNLAAIRGRADVLAHPGLIRESEVRAARALGVALELTSRSGHSLTNGHVAQLARRLGCPLVVNSDSHAPRDLHSPQRIEQVVRGAGLPAGWVRRCQNTAQSLCQRLTRDSVPRRKGD